MIEKITDQNLERYDSRLKEWCDRKFFEKGNYGKYQTTEESSAIAFYPAPNTPLEGKVKFSFKETLPANGDKGPDNPSTLVGMNSIGILHCGKNLLSPRQKTQTVQGITFTENDDGSIIVNGTNSSSTSGAYYQVMLASIGPYWKKAGFTYTLSGCPSGGSSSTYYITVFGSGLTDFGNGATNTMSVSANSSCAIVIAPSVTVSNLVFRPQLEIGSVATAFEKFAGDEYTISLNNTYYGGEIDLTTGVMTVTHAIDTLTNFNNIFSDYIQENTVAFITYSSSRHKGHISHNCWSNRFTEKMSNNDFEHFKGTGSISTGAFGLNFYINKSRLDLSGAVDSSNPTDAEWLAAGNTWLSEHPITVIYQLFTPFTVQLDPIQISVLAQTDKYTPRLNTVHTNTDTDSVQISYLKSPIRDEYEKTQAILSLGGNS